MKLEGVKNEGKVQASPHFELADVVDCLNANPPQFLDCRDEMLCIAVLEDMEIGIIDDMVKYFLIGEGVLADERRSLGPPKWMYSDDICDSFDFYSAFGCPNCGREFDLNLMHNFTLTPPALICRGCGHSPCPIHFSTESDTLISRLEKSDVMDAPVDVKTDDDLEKLNNSAEPDGAVYVLGEREQYNFGQTSKRWWQHKYLPSMVRFDDLTKTVRMIGMMSKLKAATIDEVCDICGNTQAYFHTYQARSADEGMTIMYECTRCHARKTFNN